MSMVVATCFSVEATIMALVYGADDDDILPGTSRADEIYGYAGDDVLKGYDGKDLLNGGFGADTLQGGNGNDTYVVDDAGDVVKEGPGDSGTDTVFASVSYGLAGRWIEVLTLTGAAAINAFGNSLNNSLNGNAAANRLEGKDGDDRLFGSGGNDTLLGGRGVDVLDGGTDADVLDGGPGSDTYYVDHIGDAVIEDNTPAGEDRDLIYASVSYDLSNQYVEDLTLTGSAVSATGNSLFNILRGNPGDNILDGQRGADTMYGGSGSDTYYVDNSADQIIEYGLVGIDVVYASANFALSPFVETLILSGVHHTSGAGNAANNVLTGNSGDNVLNGLGGADTMTGGAGDDTYYIDHIGDLTIESLNSGYDEVRSSVSHVLSGNLDALYLIGDAAINGTGNGLNNQIFGNDGANILRGGGGWDRFIGGRGADTFVYGDFVPGSSKAIYFIFDFTATEGDRIDLSAYSHGVPYSGVSIVRIGAGVEIDIDGAGYLYLMATSVSDVTASIIW